MNILNTGNFYVLKDDDSYEKIFDGEIKTIEFGPEPLDIMDIMNTNINIQPSIVFEVKTDLLSDNFINPFINPTGLFELIQRNKFQKRKHHKTRISKKWAKKYGYYTFEDTYEIKSFKPQDIDKEILSYDCKIKFKERRKI